MAQKIVVKPDKASLLNLSREIQEGKINIPEFQRDVVWKEKERLLLLDSIKKGYSIGSLLFWQPDSRYKCKKEFGPYNIPNRDDAKYVLDGYQRLSTLFGVLVNPANYGKEYNFNSIGDYAVFYDLENEKFTYSKRKNEVPTFYIPIYILGDTIETLTFFDKLRQNINDSSLAVKYINHAKNLAKIIFEYEISYVDIKGGEIDDAVEIFSRVNSTGTKLAKDWMISALAYKTDKYLLSQEITNFIVKLEKYNFQDIERDEIIKCIAAATGKNFSDVKSEELANNKELPTFARNTFENIEKAVEFLYTQLNIIDSKLLPYSNQLVYLSEFFRLCNPDSVKYEELKKWFWITSYSNYFTIYNSLGKQRNALNQFRKFASGESSEAVYFDNEQSFVSKPFSEKIDFGSVRSKSLFLFLLNYSNQSTSGLFDKELDVKYIINNERNIFASAVINNFDITLHFCSQKTNSKDASFLLEQDIDKEFLRKNFITDEIINLYRENKIEKLLSTRLELIQQAEQSFVESLNIVYGKDNKI